MRPFGGGLRPVFLLVLMACCRSFPPTHFYGKHPILVGEACKTRGTGPGNGDFASSPQGASQVLEGHSGNLSGPDAAVVVKMGSHFGR